MRIPAQQWAPPSLVRALLLRVHGARREELARVLGIMRLLVRFQYRRPRECLTAQHATKWSLARVHSTVIFHMMSKLERLPAEFALKRSISCMYRQMRDQRGDVGETFSTKLAQYDVPWLHGPELEVQRPLVGRHEIGWLGEGAQHRQSQRPS